MTDEPSRRRRLLPWPVKRGGQLLLIALAIEYLVLPQLAGQKQSLHLLLDVDSPWLLSTFALQLASFAAFAYGTRSMLPTEHRPPVGTIARIDLAAIGLAHSVPAGAAAGTALGLRLLSRAGVPTDSAVSAKISQSVASAVVLIVLLWSALAVAIPLHGSSPLYVAGSVTGLVVVLVAAFLILTLHRARPALARAVDLVTDRIPRVPRHLGLSLVTRIGTQLDLVLAERRRFAGAVLWVMANWLLNAASLWTAVRAYGHTLGYSGLMVSFCLAHVASWAPITPGGLGIVEGILVPTLISFTTSRPVAVLGVLTYRLASFWLTIPLGALAYGSILHTRWRARVRQRRTDQRSAQANGSPPTQVERETSG